MKIKVKVRGVRKKQEIELHIAEADERQMGTERRLSGEAYDKNGEPVELNIWEYPEGSVNHIEKDDKIVTSDNDIEDQYTKQISD